MWKEAAVTSFKSHNFLKLKRKFHKIPWHPQRKSQQCPPKSFPFHFITKHPIIQHYEDITNKRDKLTAEWRRLHIKELYDLYCSTNIIQVIKLWSTRWVGHLAYTGRGQMHTGFWWGNLRERDHLEDLAVDGSILLKWILDGRAWTGLICLRIGKGGGLLWTRQWTFGLHKMLGVSRPAEELWTSQKGLCSTYSKHITKYLSKESASWMRYEPGICQMRYLIQLSQ